ncbi:hypothetical protein [Providencia alcalifaciens]|uniref:hypothetical protein n=1 Tax=Providencia alcalifaciens TaxID=126385 RepID=UPI00044C10A7|nr:hypothetical protein [Providencia alcalifaciens]ETT04943.1 hypothetical protein HMPREF1562_2294 [Providencia alcalifaciens F90-2004]EUC96842.1 hypothetical protein HMPREF1567_0086 [Providencia alcalifaciens PAL-2]MTB31642.1 hypothetical protein [Providencia alcalifaciens]MTC97633.1 hypothetical protein [Providencia alcalifaciens]CAG9414726.1 hypothetical protein NVI2019_PLFLNFOB_01175 [Providencia alcalifaciens]
MNITQLFLLALNCINEHREPSHTEQSIIYVFYRTNIAGLISIDEFMEMFINLSVYCDSPKRNKELTIELIEKYLYKSANKLTAIKSMLT